MVARGRYLIYATIPVKWCRYKTAYGLVERGSEALFTVKSPVVRVFCPSGAGEIDGTGATAAATNRMQSTIVLSGPTAIMHSFALSGNLAATAGRERDSADAPDTGKRAFVTILSSVRYDGVPH